MFFRFAAAVTLVTCVSLWGIALEKQNLALKREISLQHYRLEILQEKRSRLILKTEQLGAPPRLMEQWERSGGSTGPVADRDDPRSIHPLLEWRLRSD